MCNIATTQRIGRFGFTSSPTAPLADAFERDVGAPRDDVEGVVLAGSYHSGDTEFERFLRGPLLPVALTPVICYPLGWLSGGGVRHATVCANSGTRAVQRYLGDGMRLQMRLRYLSECHPRGPAGCAADVARSSTAKTFVVVEGSVIPSLDLDALLFAHERDGAAVTTVVEIDRRRSASGTPRVPRSGGIYILAREALEAVPSTGFHDIKQGLLEQLYARGATMRVHEVQGLSPRVLDLATYTMTNRTVVSSALRRPEFFGDFEPMEEGLRHRQARIDEDARLIGPVLVGCGARVEAGAVIIGPTCIGAESIVEPGAVVSRSVVLDRCRIGAQALVDESLLAHGAAIDAGDHCIRDVLIADPAAEPCGPPPAIQLRMPAHLSEQLRMSAALTPAPAPSGLAPMDLVLMANEAAELALQT